VKKLGCFLRPRLAELKETIVGRSDEEVDPENLKEVHDIANALNMTLETTQRMLDLGSRNMLRQLFVHHGIT
jgi:hypothetical protein